MPLPSLCEHGAPQCKARSKRSGNRCLNPAAFGMVVCRMHGARREGLVLKGQRHPNYKHGEDTLEVRSRHREKMAELRRLEQWIQRLGLFLKN